MKLSNENMMHLIYISVKCHTKIESDIELIE